MTRLNLSFSAPSPVVLTTSPALALSFPEPQAVALQVQGIQGPPGPAGPPGTSYATRAAFVTANTATPGLGLTDGQITIAAGLEYRRLAASTAIADLAGWVPNGASTPFHFGAVGNGVADDRPAFVAANTFGGNLDVDGHFELSSPIVLTSTAPELSRSDTWVDLTDGGNLDWAYGLFRDEGFLPVNRFPGRTFFGEEARHSANRLGANGYGDDAISQNIASWMVKNAQVAAMSADSQGRIGIIGATWIQPGQAGSSSVGVAGVGRNDGVSGSARGGYFEAITARTALGAADAAAELQVGNRTNDLPVVSAYDMSNSVISGLYIGAESQAGYTTGNSDTVYPAPTQPSGAAIDISGGSLDAAYQKWVAGIVFRNGALQRAGGTFGRAVVMALNHKLQWEETGGAEAGAIWCDNGDPAQRMALAIRSRNITLYGPSGQVVGEFRHDNTGAGTVNSHLFRAARTAVNPAILAEGSDANIGNDIISKGTGVVRMMSHGGSGENLRITPSATAPTDYLTIGGTAGGGRADIGAAGASTNIAIRLTPKGTGAILAGTTSAASGAYFDIASTTGGLAIPRLTTTERDAIASPANGVMIYNTTTNALQVRASGAWISPGFGFGLAEQMPDKSSDATGLVTEAFRATSGTLPGSGSWHTLTLSRASNAQGAQVAVRDGTVSTDRVRAAFRYRDGTGTWSSWLEAQPILSGTTAARPTTQNVTGLGYYDTTIDRPVFRNAANSGWIDISDRATHTGSQLAATISDFATAVAATAAVTANTAKVSNATHTGDVTGSTALTIANDAVTNAKLANMATGTIKGRTTAGTGDPEDLTPAQARAVVGLPAITVSTTAPGSPAVGDLWVDTN